MITQALRQAEFFTCKAKKYHQKTKPFFIFLKEIIANPREIGAGCPSSPYLARTMAKEVDYQADGIILELGGGTGVITHALLQQGVSPDKLITIERSPTLAAYLRQKFPDICVIEGDASQLDKLLENNIGKINAVISSLPLRSLPKSSVTAIKQQINKVLDKNGLFIQFTYDLRVTPLSKSLDTHFSCKNTQLVWKNLPPARVDTFIQS